MDLKNVAAKLESGPDYSAVLADLASLRADIARLAANVSTEARNAGTQAADSLNSSAHSLYDGMSDSARTTAKAAGAQMDAHPMMSLILAFSLGFVGSKLLSR